MRGYLRKPGQSWQLIVNGGVAAQGIPWERGATRTEEDIAVWRGFWGDGDPELLVGYCTLVSFVLNVDRSPALDDEPTLEPR